MVYRCVVKKGCAPCKLGLHGDVTENLCGIQMSPDSFFSVGGIREIGLMILIKYEQYALDVVIIHTYMYIYM